MLETTTAFPASEVLVPQVGDHVLVVHDTLAEVGREAAGLPPTWITVGGGTRGKVLGWRDRPDADPRMVIELYGVERRVVVFVTAQRVVRSNTFELPTLVAGAPRIRRRHR
jgi:hypothetical protein